MSEDSANFGRIVNNISMAILHSGIVAAVKDLKNGVLQPGTLTVWVNTTSKLQYRHPPSTSSAPT
ncbi:hypothetical protein ABVK25_004946 [Lepraria finkii]|uniref:Uncharacterized protein n=1 Tax=Lepraria finkii TaxID=1340010 RepID=A0ABR4B9W1_9LECA